MYRCTDCEKVFISARTVFETHGMVSPPYERRKVCPVCGSENFTEMVVRHCRCCGARLKEGRYDYCDESCRIRGEKLWQRQARRRRRYESSPLYMKVAKIERYNREHGTDLSYGQYVALIEG